MEVIVLSRDNYEFLEFVRRNRGDGFNYVFLEKPNFLISRNLAPIVRDVRIEKRVVENELIEQEIHNYENRIDYEQIEIEIERFFLLHKTTEEEQLNVYLGKKQIEDDAEGLNYGVE